VLIHCSDEWVDGQFLEYFAQLAGEKMIQCVSETDIVIAPNRQSPDPYQQMLSYEFQNPIWKFQRDRVVESYSELHNATFGIEELVGARIMLLAHQAEVVARVLADTTCRYILADEVGLGKTIEASVILKGLCRRDPQLTLLIAAPSSLIQQWHNELDTKFWLDIPILHSVQQLKSREHTRRYIVSIEQLAEDIGLGGCG
jgi:SNF2 family DNA or RNA helicase